MFGFNSEQVYKDELGALNNRGTEIEFDPGDWIRQGYGALIGKDYSKEGLLKGAAKIRNQKLKDTYDPVSQAMELGPLTANYQGPEGKTEAEVKAAQLKDRNREAALQQYKASGYGDIGDLSPTASTGTILGLMSKGERITKKKDEDQIYQRDVVRQDELNDRANARQDDLLERQDIRQERADIRQDKRLAQDRRLSAETNQINVQLKYAQLAQADRNRQQDRKDRAIMSLISGLGNLGAAFAI